MKLIKTDRDEYTDTSTGETLTATQAAKVVFNNYLKRTKRSDQQEMKKYTVLEARSKKTNVVNALVDDLLTQ